MTTRSKITIAVLTLAVTGLIIAALLGRVPWSFVIAILIAIGGWAIILWSLSRVLRRVSPRTRIIILALSAGALGGYAAWQGSQQNRGLQPPDPARSRFIASLSRESSEELTQRLVQELTNLRDNIDRGITSDELKARKTAIGDIELTMIFNQKPLPKPAEDTMRDVVIALRGGDLKDLRAKTELAILALSSTSAQTPALHPSPATRGHNNDK